MNVLSLFDGKSGAMAALQLNGNNPASYFASEIDKYSQQVSRYHYPEIIRTGDVTKVNAADLPSIDLLVAGYPCQAFSFAGKQLNFEDPRGKLFFEVVRLLNELKPKFFLLENVRMKKDVEDEINKLVGVKPVMINSAKLGAQNRQRNYWAGGYKDGKVYQIDIPQPEDMGILLKDIIENGESEREKSHCLDANYFKGSNWEQYIAKSRRQLIITGGAQRGRYLDDKGKRLDSTVDSQAGLTEQRIELRDDGKSNCLTTVQKDSLAISCKSQTILSTIWKENPKSMLKRKKMGLLVGLMENQDINYRKLTPIECERLQNYQDNHTALGIDDKGNNVKISNTQRYKMLGNGFDCATVAHCLKHILEVSK